MAKLSFKLGEDLTSQEHQNNLPFFFVQLKGEGVIPALGRYATTDYCKILKSKLSNTHDIYGPYEVIQNSYIYIIYIWYILL